MGAENDKIGGKKFSITQKKFLGLLEVVFVFVGKQLMHKMGDGNGSFE